jgi:amidase
VNEKAQKFSISVDQVHFINQELGLGLNSDQVLLAAEACVAITSEYEFINNTGDPKLANSRKHTRPKENEHNAWTYQCDLRESKTGSLAGLTFAIKDSINLAGIPMAMGSEILDGWVPQTDATVVSRILTHGGAILGKTTTENLCISGGSVTSWPLPVNNPAALGFSAGGSSSGSAAVVANNEVDVALGGDQGGSIRIPAAFCGVLGHKPTHGLVPYTGIASLMPSLDHVGPIARSARNLALTLDAIAGPDQDDPRQAALRGPAPWPNGYQMCEPELDKGVAGLRIGLLQEGFEITKNGDANGFPGSAAAAELVRKQTTLLTEQGAIVSPVSIPIHEHAAKIYGPILIDGTYQSLSLIAGRNFAGFGRDESATQEISRRITKNPEKVSLITAIVLIAGRHMELLDDGAVYSKASGQVSLLRNAYQDAFENFDAIVCPATGPAGLPTKQTGLEKNLLSETMSFYANTAATNLTGHPSTNVPVGLIDGLPVSAMITTNYWQDACAIRIAQALQSISQ